MTHRSFILLLFAIVFIISCSNNEVTSDEEELAVLVEREDQFFESISEKNLSETVQFFSDSAVIQAAGMPEVSGWEAIEKFYGNMFGFIESSKATPEAIVLSENKDMAYSRGRTTNTFRGAQTYTGKYLLVWEKSGEEWLIAAYSISSNE